MLVDTGATHSYISKQFFKQIKELDYEVKKPNNDKLIVANGQQLQILGQVLIPIEVGHVNKHLLFRLVPELRSIGILGTDMIERLGLKLDFEKKIWWLPEKPQIRYKIEANPKENRVIWNEDGKGREPRKESLEERTRVRNKIKLRNQEVRPANNLQWGEIPTSTPTNHTLPEVDQIMNTRWSEIPGTRKGKTE